MITIKLKGHRQTVRKKQKEKTKPGCAGSEQMGMIEGEILVIDVIAVHGDVDVGDNDGVLTSDVVAEDARRDDVATGAEQPFQVRLMNIMRIVLVIMIKLGSCKKRPRVKFWMLSLNGKLISF